jgi:predicted PurR-regulated permease PerM
MASPDAFFDQPRRIVAATLVAAAVVAAFGLIYIFGDVLFCLFVGIVLATALKPLVEVLQRFGVRQPVAVMIVYGCAALIFAAAVGVGAPILIYQGRAAVTAIPQAFDRAYQRLASAGDASWVQVIRRVVDMLSPGGDPRAAEKSLATVGQTASYLAVALHAVLTGGLVVLLAFYWSLQGDRTMRWCCLLLPQARRDSARSTLAEIEAKLGAYIRGQGFVCLAMACMAAVIYGLLGLPSAVALGLFAGLCEVVPVFGPILAAVPPLVVAIVAAPEKTGWVAVAAVVMQQIESYLIVPPIMDKSVGVHPMATLLAIALFGSLLGIPGAILAIPLAAIVQVLLNRHVLVPETRDRNPLPGRGPLSVLHYDTRSVLADIQLRAKAESPGNAVGRLAEEIEAVARALDQRLNILEDDEVFEAEKGDLGP